MKYDILTLEGAVHRITITAVDNTDLSNYTFYGNCACSCSTKSFIINGNEIIIPALKCGTYDYQLFAKNDDKEYMLLQGVIIADDRLSCTNNDEVYISSEITNLQISITAATNLSDYQNLINQILDKYAHCKNVSEVKAVDSNYKLDLTSKGQWLYDLPALTNGRNMFRDCSNLRSFNSDLPALTDGYCMFLSCSNLSSFSSDLSNLSDGSWMFQECTNLRSFSSDLPNLTNGRNMFSQCKNLTSFSADLPKLTNGNVMFHTCTNLISFSSDLPALSDGHLMFWECTNLRSFEGDLSALISGSSMFQYCKLDLASVQNIANTINDLTVAGTTGTINIGMSSTIQDTPELETALATIRAKGWTVEEQYN